ncbi:hypothetical protein ACJX0J_018613, partial [Zea mays]
MHPIHIEEMEAECAAYHIDVDYPHGVKITTSEALALFDKGGWTDLASTQEAIKVWGGIGLANTENLLEKGVKICLGAPSVSHLLFAGDSLILQMINKDNEKGEVLAKRGWAMVKDLPAWHANSKGNFRMPLMEENIKIKHFLWRLAHNTWLPSVAHETTKLPAR